MILTYLGNFLYSLLMIFVWVGDSRWGMCSGCYLVRRSRCYEIHLPNCVFWRAPSVFGTDGARGSNVLASPLGLMAHAV